MYKIRFISPIIFLGSVVLGISGIARFAYISFNSLNNL